MKTIFVFLLLGSAVPGFTAKAAAKIPPQAEELLKQGKALDQEGKLVEARDKFLEAAKTWPKAGKEVAAINKRIGAKTAEILKLAQASFEAKDYKKAIELLTDAQKLSPESESVVCDFGLAYHASGDDARAMESLHSCVEKVKKIEEKSRYEQLITQIETADKPLTLDAAQKKNLDEFNQGLRENQQTLSAQNADADLCKKLLDNQANLPKTPSVLLNLAKCSEATGQLEQASKYFSDYLAAAPDSRAVPDVRDASAELAAIFTFEGAKKEEVRGHYGLAARHLANGSYALALKEYEAVREIAPDFAYGRRQLGLFYEALGRTDDASRELTAYAAFPAVTAEDRDWTAKEISSFPAKRARYDAAVKEAVEDVKPLLFVGHSLNSSTSVKCDAAIKKLLEAKAEFALGPEANRILGFLYVEADYAAGARLSYDASVAGGKDPFFFAWVSPKPVSPKLSNFSLVVVKKDGLQIEPVFSIDMKKRKKGEALPPAVAGLSPGFLPQSCQASVMNADVTAAPPPCGDFLKATDIKSIEPKQFGVEISTADKAIWLEPVNFFENDPVTFGPAARKFENRYARILRRYMENDVTKLGAEHMTGGEKAKLGLMIAASAMGGAAGAMSAVNAASAAINMSIAAMQALQVIQSYRMQAAALARPMVYKALPVDPTPLAFRVE